MGRPYSLDLRERVVASVAAGESCRAVARAFKVSVASVVKWSQRYRATGSAAAKPMGKRRGSSSLAGEREWLLDRLAAAPDVTLRGLVAELRERGVVTSYGAVWRIVHGAGVTFKKNTVRRRARSARRRTPARPLEALPKPA
jgi:transposase